MSTSYQYHEVWQSSIGSARMNPSVIRPKGGSLAGLGGDLAKHLAVAVQVFPFYSEFILRRGNHSPWMWMGW